MWISSQSVSASQNDTCVMESDESLSCKLEMEDECERNFTPGRFDFPQAAQFFPHEADRSAPSVFADVKPVVQKVSQKLLSKHHYSRPLSPTSSSQTGRGL